MGWEYKSEYGGNTSAYLARIKGIKLRFVSAAISDGRGLVDFCPGGMM